MVIQSSLGDFLLYPFCVCVCFLTNSLHITLGSNDTLRLALLCKKSIAVYKPDYILFPVGIQHSSNSNSIVGQLSVAYNTISPVHANNRNTIRV